MRIGLVAAGYGSLWNEPEVLARRLAGALACSADVDVLVPGGEPGTGYDGAVRVLRFPATAPDRTHLAAWKRVVFGRDNLHDASRPRTGCERRSLPSLVEEQLVFAEGGHAPQLYEHLHRTTYDLVMFVGLHSPATYWGVRALVDNRRIALVPGTADEDVVSLGIHASTWERAERVIVCTEFERVMWSRLLGSEETKIENIGFLVGVNPLARITDPHDLESERYLVVPEDWTRRDSPGRIVEWAKRIALEVDPDLRLRLVGPGAERFPFGVNLTASRLDMWRWMSRATMVLDQRPRQLLGREVLEAFLYETPVIVHADGGASREHAENGDGGLWFRTDDELCAVVKALLDDELARAMGKQGRAYAEQRYADTDSFVKRIEVAFLS